MKIVLCVAVCLAASCAASASDERRGVPKYTNEDLARVSALRGETGVYSRPVAVPEGRAARPREPRATRGEQFWRQEAERERRRLAPLRQRLASLEHKLEERRREAGAFPRGRSRPRSFGDPSVRSYEAQVRTLRDYIREEEARFEDRARREGALPGWLRP